MANIEQHYFKNYRKNEPYTVLTLLRACDSEQLADDGPIGASFWLEGGERPCTSTTLAPPVTVMYIEVAFMR